MKTYEVIIHYVIPSRCGGIQSETHSLVVSAINEEKAEEQAIIRGVNDPNYLYTNLVEANLIAGI